MSEKDFLERWSRLKHDAAHRRESEPAAQKNATERAAEPKPEDGPAGPAAEPAAFDPASLPSIESITAVSDIRAFLAPGVPAALTHAALRRAWAADPAIRDFIGLSENAWDFNDPTSIPGFGDIGGSENLRRLVAHLTDGTGTVSEDRPSEADPEGPEGSQLASDSTEAPVRVSAAEKAEHADEPAPPDTQADLLQHSIDAVRLKDPESSEYPSVAQRRGHGSALPE